MFEELTAQLDEMGIAYDENTETGVLTIDIADVDKVTLIDVINLLNNSGETFDITESEITVQGTPTVEDETSSEGESTDYMGEALSQMGNEY